MKHDAWQKTLTCPLIEADGRLPPEENYEIISAYLKQIRKDHS